MLLQKEKELEAMKEAERKKQFLEQKRILEEEEAKKAAAEKYCEYASAYTEKNGGKKWQYILIPFQDITRTVSLDFLVSKFG